MPWDLSEFESKRLEKGRRLLQESEHRGCRDLKLYVESLDLTVQVHRHFLADRGQRRQGLTNQEKLQGLVVVCHMMLCCHSAAYHNTFIGGECGPAIKDVCGELHRSQLPWGKLMANVATAAANCVQSKSIPSDYLWHTVEAGVNTMSSPHFSALASAIESYQRSAGFEPVLTAAEMRLLMLYTQQQAVTVLLQKQPQAPKAQQWLAAGLSATRQLLQLDPSAAACLHYKSGCLMAAHSQRPEALAAFRSALRETREHKSHIVEAMAATQLASVISWGFAGPCWSVEEVQGLLKTAKTALAKLKHWVPPELLSSLKSSLAEITGTVATAAAGRPGASMLPASTGQPGLGGGCVVPSCSGCGEQASSLKKCSSCGVAAYCSRACQVQHWKEGGHKQECAQLAAGSSGGAGSSRS